ncbi:MAG TPA: trypsin-like peptidase domain-containing protein [Candidatus Doudnabacteria bacterium]|nr:trypsin-like peptidase domain-containing protein [Candidatus Doudnabacteria bacterium]
MKDFQSKPVHNQNIEEPSTVLPDAGLTSEGSVGSPHHLGYGIVVLALVAGMIGGLIGALYLAPQPFFGQLFGQRQSTLGTLQQNVAVTEESATTEVVQRSGPAVVSIVISRPVSRSSGVGFGPFGFFPIPTQDDQLELREVGAGTGFFVSSDGWIMTNRHVINDDTATYTVLTNDGRSYDAKVMAKDPANDLALIKIDISDAPFLEFADSDNLQLGQRVIAIGNTLGSYQNTVTSGVISGIGRNIRAGGSGLSELLDGVIQTDAAINSGNSGGPLLDLAGFVVGINTAVDRSGQAIGFAIPANDARAALASYEARGRIVRPYLGVRYAMITSAMAQVNSLPRDYGALIVRGTNSADFAVIPNSPADRAGLRENDIILELDGQRLDENNSLIRALKKYQPGDRAEAKIFREDSERIVTITIGETGS